MKLSRRILSILSTALNQISENHAQDDMVTKTTLVNLNKTLYGEIEELNEKVRKINGHIMDFNAFSPLWKTLKAINVSGKFQEIRNKIDDKVDDFKQDYQETMATVNQELKVIDENVKENAARIAKNTGYISNTKKIHDDMTADINQFHKEVNRIDEKLETNAEKILENGNMIRSFEYNCPTQLSPNYKIIQGNCYYFETEPLPYGEAQENCFKIFGSEYPGMLVEPENYGINRALHSTVIKAYDTYDPWWIGITNYHTKDEYLYASSGQPLKISRWDSSEVKDISKNCVSKGGLARWKTSNCSLTMPSVCQINYKKNKTDSAYSCSKYDSINFINTGSSCLYIQSSKKLGFQKAQEFCDNKFIASKHQRGHFHPDNREIFELVFYEMSRRLNPDFFNYWIGIWEYKKHYKYSTGMNI